MQNALLGSKLTEAEQARVEAAQAYEDSVRLLNEKIQALDLEVFNSTSLIPWVKNRRRDTLLLRSLS